MPELGTPSETRQGLEGMDDYAIFLRSTNERLKTEKESIAEVTSFVKERPSVLVCMEVIQVCCHRSRSWQMLSPNALGCQFTTWEWMMAAHTGGSGHSDDLPSSFPWQSRIGLHSGDHRSWRVGRKALSD